MCVEEEQYSGCAAIDKCLCGTGGSEGRKEEWDDEHFGMAWDGLGSCGVTVNTHWRVLLEVFFASARAKRTWHGMALWCIRDSQDGLLVHNFPQSRKARERWARSDSLC